MGTQSFLELPLKDWAQFVIIVLSHNLIHRPKIPPVMDHQCAPNRCARGSGLGYKCSRRTRWVNPTLMRRSARLSDLRTWWVHRRISEVEGCPPHKPLAYMGSLSFRNRQGRCWDLETCVAVITEPCISIRKCRLHPLPLGSLLLDFVRTISSPRSSIIWWWWWKVVHYSDRIGGLSNCFTIFGHLLESVSLRTVALKLFKPGALG